MRCDEARQGLGAWRDGELSADDGHEIAAHVAECAACAEEDRALRRLSSALSGLRHHAPDNVDRIVYASLPTDPVAEQHMPVPIIPAALAGAQVRTALNGVRAIAATAVLAAAVGWFAATAWHVHRAQVADVSREIVMAHVRSLITDSPVQVVHGDPHQVKPWFSGRVDFAPSVRDLREDGFTLIGGRIDIVGGHRVAVAVYKRRLHLINVFMWPDAAATQLAAERPEAAQGYNLLRWSHDGMVYWAASDLNARELAELSSLL